MAIGVFIAPILLYWEALSSENPGQGNVFLCPEPQTLANLPITPAVAVRCLDQERIFIYLQQLIAIGCSAWNSAESVADVRIKQYLMPDGPPASKFGNEPCVLPHFASEGAVPLKRVITALLLIHISPMAYEFSAGPSFHAGAGDDCENEK